MVGTIIAQGLSFLSSPFLSRIFTPEQFGKYAFILSIVGILLPLSTGRFEQAIVSRNDLLESKRIVYLSFFLLVVSSLITLIVTLAIRLFNTEYQYILYIPFLLFFVALTGILVQWLNKCGKYSILGIHKIIKSLLFIALTIILGLIYKDSLSLIIGSIFATIVALLFLMLFSKNTELYNFKGISRKSLISSAKDCQDFPRYNMLQAFINTVSVNLPITLLTIAFSSEATGYYSMALRLILTPATIISTSVYPVLYKKFSESRNNKEYLRSILKKILKTYFFIVSIPFIIIIITAPDLLGFFLGPTWLKTGYVVSIFAPLAFFILVGSSIAFIPIVYDKQKKVFVIVLCELIVRLIILLSAFYMNDFMITILLLTIFSSGIKIYRLIWTYSLLK